MQWKAGRAAAGRRPRSCWSARAARRSGLYFLNAGCATSGTWNTTSTVFASSFFVFYAVSGTAFRQIDLLATHGRFLFENAERLASSPVCRLSAAYWAGTPVGSAQFCYTIHHFVTVLPALCRSPFCLILPTRCRGKAKKRKQKREIMPSSVNLFDSFNKHRRKVLCRASSRSVCCFSDFRSLTESPSSSSQRASEIATALRRRGSRKRDIL